MIEQASSASVSPLADIEDSVRGSRIVIGARRRRWRWLGACPGGDE